MAIEKRFIHFKKFSDFNSKKLSANEANTQYTLGISGEIQEGSPDVLYQSYVWIKDTRQQWTHGQLYDGSGVDIDPSQFISKDDVDAELSETSTNPVQNNVVFYTFSQIVNDFALGLELKQDGISDLETIRDGAAKGATAVQPSSLATVATSGNYNDLTNKPTIPASVTESTVSGWGFTKNTGTYSKPNGGIPKSDLDDAVQASINRADNSLQIEIFGDMEITTLNGIAGGSTGKLYALPEESTGDEDDILLSKKTVKTINGESIYGSGDITILGGSGTITEIKANGTSVATSGVANIPAATTSAYGVTKLTSSTSSTSTTLAATASAVKAAYDLANNYKGTVTGVKINGSTKSPSSGVVDLGTVITTHQVLKTINGESIVGSGDITISGGSSGANVQAVDTGDVLDDVTVDYATKTYVDGLVGDINSVLESIING